MGNEVVVNLAGKATVRAELSSGGMNANYYMFVPVTALPGPLQFEQSSWSVDENGGSATITVTRAGGSAGAVGVSYSTSNGSAVAGADYTAASGTLSWASGDMSPRTFQVPILNDTLVEGTETITLSLSNPTGVGTLGPQSAATLTIPDAPPTAVSYALTLVPSPSAGGTITASPGPDGNGKYVAGTLVTLTPQPASGYVFSSWSGDASGDKPASITMDGNKTVTANFSMAPTRYLLFLGISPAGSGSISASPSPGTDGKYALGAVVTLTATAASGYQFSGWGGDVTGSANPATLTLDRNKTVVANFVNLSEFLPGLRRQIYTNLLGSSIANLTSSPNFPGAPDLVDSVPMLESQYLPNDAGENYGQRLTGWLVPPVTGDYVFYLAADDQAQVFLSTDDFPANKRLIVQELTWSPARNWAGTSTNPQRASAAIRLVASAYYYLEVLHKEGTGEDHVGLAWCLPGGAPPLNGDPPIGNEHLVYRVDMPEALWTVQPADAGTVRLSPAPPAGGWYTNGTVVTLTAVPALGYRFTGWSGAFSSTANPATLTVAGNPTATANFVLDVADITQAGDSIVAMGGSSPSSEGVANAIDNQSSSKYFNYGKLNTGFTVTPKVGATVVVGLGLTSANDCPERDPASYRLEGSRDGQTFVELATGTVPAFASRLATWKVFFTNGTAYEMYRVTFPAVADAATAIAMQIAEVELLGTVAPTTSSRLISAYSNGVLTLTWDGSKFVLESTESLRSPVQWTIVSGVVGNRLETRCQTATRFYRLRH